jgi:hypothetical protein
MFLILSKLLRGRSCSGWLLNDRTWCLKNVDASPAARSLRHSRQRMRHLHQIAEMDEV